MNNITNNPYDMNEIEWLREYYPKYGKESVDMFNKHFGVNYTYSMIKHRCQKYNIRSNNDGKYKKGSKPWNTGINYKEEYPELYKKVYEQNQGLWKRKLPPLNKCEVGTIRKLHNGNYIKIANPSEWQLYSRYVYEKAHDIELPDDLLVLHLDGNIYNDSIENLVPIDRKTLLRMNQKRYCTNDAELTKLGLNIVLLKQMMRDKQGGKDEENKRAKDA